MGAIDFSVDGFHTMQRVVSDGLWKLGERARQGL